MWGSADQFDVHAHQVLHHLRCPIAAVREMRRVCAPAGIVAVQDADYSAMTWFPDHPAMTRWLELYRQVTRRKWFAILHGEVLCRFV